MITVVVGSQYGGEGKGKICAYIAHSESVDIACRCGGPNSSHTVVWNGKTYRLRMLPTAACINPSVQIAFGAGSLIHIPTLMREIDELQFQGTLRIDYKAGIVTDEIVRDQRADPRYRNIGSTLTGTGYASARRCLRSLPLARDVESLRDYLCDVSIELGEQLNDGAHVLVEGHQGFGLSNYHGDYPFVSSRDSTAASMLAELGLGPIQKAMRVVLVAKAFPTRNHAGRLDGEMTTKQADALGIHEFGGGSWGIGDNRRRVGLIEFEIIRRAATANTPTEIALTGMDYLLKAFAEQPDLLRPFLNELEKAGDAPIRYISWGSETEKMVERKKNQSLATWLDHWPTFFA